MALSLSGCADAGGDGNTVIYRGKDAGGDSGADASAFRDAELADASRDADVQDAQAPGPRCDDGVRNQNETGIDCGGVCRACAACDTCESREGCPAAYACVGGRCVREVDVTVDWLANGVDRETLDYTKAVNVSGLPAGQVQAVATGGGATPWSVTVHDPPTRGYTYRISCDGIDLGRLAAPEGVYYPTAAEAFAAVPTKSVNVEYDGSAIRCYQLDSGCSDNSGAVSFTLRAICPP